MTSVELFDEDGVEVVANAVLAGGPKPNMLETGVGVVHKVWGWRTTMHRALHAAGIEPRD